MKFVGSIGPENHRSQARQSSGHVVEQFAGGRIGPMKVFEDDEDAILLSWNAEEGKDCLEESELCLGRVALLACAGVGLDLGEEVGELTPSWA